MNATCLFQDLREASETLVARYVLDEAVEVVNSLMLHFFDTAIVSLWLDAEVNPFALLHEAKLVTPPDDLENLAGVYFAVVGNGLPSVLVGDTGGQVERALLHVSLGALEKIERHALVMPVATRVA